MYVACSGFTVYSDASFPRDPGVIIKGAIGIRKPTYPDFTGSFQKHCAENSNVPGHMSLRANKAAWDPGEDINRTDRFTNGRRHLSYPAYSIQTRITRI